MDNQSPRSLPFSDACKILLSSDLISDIDEALEFLGVRRGAPIGNEFLERGPLGLDHPGTEMIEFFEALALEEESELAEDVNLESLADVREEQIVEEILAKMGSEVGDSEDPNLDISLTDRRRRANRPERSMVAYLLAPDQDSTEQEELREHFDYSSIPDKLQKVQTLITRPTAEAWRVAHKAVDFGPKRLCRGKVDILRCVELIARREAIGHMPHSVESKVFERIEILVDMDLIRGVFLTDSSKVLSAFDSVLPKANRNKRQFVVSDQILLCGKGAVWNFRPVDLGGKTTWYIIVTGGRKFSSQCEKEWKVRLAEHTRGHFVLLIWIGDSVLGLSAHGRVGYVAYGGKWRL